jgi:hypothetical protein
MKFEIRQVYDLKVKKEERLNSLILNYRVTQKQNVIPLQQKIIWSQDKNSSNRGGTNRYFVDEKLPFILRHPVDTKIFDFIQNFGNKTNIQSENLSLFGRVRICCHMCRNVRIFAGKYKHERARKCSYQQKHSMFKPGNLESYSNAK